MNKKHRLMVLVTATQLYNVQWQQKVCQHMVTIDALKLRCSIPIPFLIHSNTILVRLYNFYDWLRMFICTKSFLLWYEIAWQRSETVNFIFIVNWQDKRTRWFTWWMNVDNISHTAVDIFGHSFHWRALFIVFTSICLMNRKFPLTDY